MSKQKVVKFKKRKRINLGVIVFLILFLYIAINVYIYFTKEQLTIYEVHEGSTAIDNRITGLILRNEEIFTSDKAGYVSYYKKEGARVAKNETVYSIDDTGMMSDLLTSGDVPIKISKQDSAELLHSIHAFRTSFNDDDFSSVYHFKDNMEGTVLDILNTTILNNQQALFEATGQSYNLNAVTSPNSGIVTYYTDGYEDIEADQVSKDMFNLEEYARTGLRTTDIVDQNTPIYKLITSEKWNIILPLTEEQYDMLSGKEQVRFTILEDDLDLTAALSLSQRGSDRYAKLTLNKYLSNYIEDRYLEVKLDFDTVEGLKIPLSSIIEKEFYLVPLEYFTKGGDSMDDGLIVESYDEKSGEAKHTFTPTEIYYQDDAYAYVDTKDFESNTIIKYPVKEEMSNADKKDLYRLGPTNKLIGVYNVNQGYAVFRRIEILYENKEYAIVKSNTPKGLSAYDQIALDGKTAVDEAIIY